MNLANFRLVLDRIKANPEKWNQGSWCGTSYCMAGHAYVLATDTEPRWNALFSVEDEARRFLQIDGYPMWIFEFTRTLEDFERVAQGEIDEHGKPIL